MSGKGAGFHRPPPLRTGHDGFLSSGSSRYKALLAQSRPHDRSDLSCCLYDACIQPTERDTQTLTSGLVPGELPAGRGTHGIHHVHLRFLPLIGSAAVSYRTTSWKWARFHGGAISPYPTHYRTAFAFSSLLRPLSHQPTLQ
jgi:hypothetical protein